MPKIAAAREGGRYQLIRLLRRFTGVGPQAGRSFLQQLRR
jgi:hypothetical protein